MFLAIGTTTPCFQMDGTQPYNLHSSRKLRTACCHHEMSTHSALYRILSQPGALSNVQCCNADLSSAKVKGTELLSPTEGSRGFFFHTPFCTSSEESVVGLLAAGCLLLTTGGVGRRGPGRIRGRGRTACISPSARRRGPHANRAWVLRPIRLPGAARGVWRRRRAEPQRRAVRTSGRPRT